MWAWMAATAYLRNAGFQQWAAPPIEAFMPTGAPQSPRFPFSFCSSRQVWHKLLTLTPVVKSPWHSASSQSIVHLRGPWLAMDLGGPFQQLDYRAVKCAASVTAAS